MDCQRSALVRRVTQPESDFRGKIDVFRFCVGAFRLDGSKIKDFCLPVTTGRDAFAKNQHPTETRVHSTPARRLHPRRHGKPSTLATQSSSSRSSRKLRGTSPLIAPLPARRRRVSGARRTVFSRRIELARARRLRRDETSTPRVRRIVSTADDARDRAIDRRRAFARGIPLASSIDLLDSRVLRSESLATRLSSFQSRFRANQRDRATLFCRVPRARAGRPGPGTRAAAASRRGGVLARARAPRSDRDLPEPVPAALEVASIAASSRIAQSEKGGNIRGRYSAPGRTDRRDGAFSSFSVSVFFFRARGTDAPLGAARRRRARLTPNRETD